MISQENMILHHLIEIGPITPLEALKLYGVLRLGGRIYDLRNKGWGINTEIIHQSRRHYAKYSLESGSNNDNKRKH